MVSGTDVQSLGFENKYIVTLVTGRKMELFIFNSFSGEVLKLRNVAKDETLMPLVKFLQEEGVRSADGITFRAIMEAYEIRQLLYVPPSGKLSETYEKISEFLLG